MLENARRVLWIVSLGLGTFGGTSSLLAQDQTQQALQMIRQTAAEICTVPPLEGQGRDVDLSGDAQAKLAGVLSRVANLGVSGAAKYQSSQYKGLLQQQLADALKNSNDCRLTVFKTLAEKLLPSDQSRPTAPVTSSLQPVHQVDPFTTFPMQATAECFRHARAGITIQETTRSMPIEAGEKAQLEASYKDFPSDCAPSLRALERLNACLVDSADTLITELEDLSSGIPPVVKLDNAFCRVTQQLNTSELLAKAQHLKSAEEALRALTGKVQSCNNRMKSWLSERSTASSDPTLNSLRIGANDQVNKSVLRQEELLGKLSAGIKKDYEDLNYIVMSRSVYCGG